MTIDKFKKNICLRILFIFSLLFSFSVNTKAADTVSTEKIKVDCLFSVGEACRPCNYIQKYNMRFQAAPLDWMMNYSLDIVIHLFETQFSDFFEEIEEIPDKFCVNCKFVKDKKNGIISIHHFNRYAPLDEEHKKFREAMLNRAKKVDNILKDSDSIGLICNRKDETTENLINFAKKFSEIYPNKKIVLINIVHIPNTEKVHESVLFDENNIKIVQFVFSDIPHIKDPVKFPQWKGNQLAWEEVFSRIELSQKFLNYSLN